ncbi:hypothetical protein C0J52_01760 [Blattella germanica]|nr:hypothetical protein C0J52_01760 [Blattella germanica]
MDWSWRLRRPSWLRASMRRVTHFQLSEPPPPLPPLATTDTVLDILESNRRPNSAPGGGASRSRRPDFPRRYSSYSASILNSSSVTNLTQAAEPVAVESPSSDDDEEEEEEEEEDISSSSEGTRSPGHQQQSPQQGADTDPEQLGSSSPLGEWPHSLSSMLASLGCTLGLFNISRFAIFTNFIVQFLLLSLLLGIPLFTLNTSLGQCLCAGVMDMWHISPIFQGVGIALLVAQALIGIYSIVGISWMFIYFRDSFITKQDRYRWAEPYQPYREDYLNGIVLQRHSLAGPDSSFGHLKFQVAFNLAVVWMIVFVSLSKGLKSYGKVVYVFSLFPVFGMLVLCTKLLGLTPMNSTHQLFPETVWGEFFLNTRCWVAAMTEVFFTWGLFGAAAMQIASHNRHKHLLSRDMSLVVVLTLAVLLLSAFLANTCVTLLKSHGFDYIPSSFERLPPMHTSTPVRYMSHTTLIAGTRIVVTADQRHQSGYQVLRLATELVPSTFALLGADAVSPFWAVLFYFVLILFGIAQQLCIWHCVITGIMAINAATLKSWETTITFFCCAGGFILGLPMTTELGIFVVYFLDYSLGCAWWIMLLYFLEIIAVFVVRGRPYSGETVVATLFNRAGCLQTWAAPMLIFTWNVILPVTLIVTCIAVFKSGQFRDLYDWRAIGYEYWPSWTRELGCTLQIIPIAIVPLICVAQTFRYLSNGPRDILDRIQLLYRPTLTQQDLITSPPNSPTNSAASAPPATNTTLPTPAPEVSVATFEDPPPKYTPPPSYTTATGARIAKLLRQSFRRSVRRLTNALSDTSNSAQPPPPDYAAVLVEINRTLQDQELQEVTHDSDPTASQSSAATNRTTLSAADVANILRSSFRRNAQRNRDAERLVEGAAPIHLDRGNSPPATRAETESKVENSSVI